jgi:hypothetical protein
MVDISLCAAKYVVGHKDNITPPLVRITHAVCVRRSDTRARVHDPRLILALVVPRRERLYLVRVETGQTVRIQ